MTTSEQKFINFVRENVQLRQTVLFQNQSEHRSKSFVYMIDCFHQPRMSPSCKTSSVHTESDAVSRSIKRPTCHTSYHSFTSFRLEYFQDIDFSWIQINIGLLKFIRTYSTVNDYKWIYLLYQHVGLVEDVGNNWDLPFWKFCSSKIYKATAPSWLLL